jgi:hypothetical protein
MMIIRRVGLTGCRDLLVNLGRYSISDLALGLGNRHRAEGAGNNERRDESLRGLGVCAAWENRV